MTKLHKTTMAFLLAAALLMTGCTERKTNPVPGSDTNTNTSSDISDSNSSESTDNSSESSVSSYNSTSTKSESSSSDTPDSVSESESNSEESSDVNGNAVPVAFTNEDKELQKMLSDLIDPTNEIYNWFNDFYGLLSTKYKIKLNEIPESELDYYLFPDKNILEKVTVSEIPTTRAEMKNIMLEYFSEDITECLLSKIYVCSAQEENPDGSYTLKDVDKFPVFVEIGGQLYRNEGVRTTGILIDVNTVKLSERSDDTIKFTFLSSNWVVQDDNLIYLNDMSLYAENASNGVLKYERGGWKLDSWGRNRDII